MPAPFFPLADRRQGPAAGILPFPALRRGSQSAFEPERSEKISMTDDRNREDGRNKAHATEPHNRLSKDHVLKRVLAYIFPYLFGLKELFANSRKLQVLLDDDFAVAPEPASFDEPVIRHPTSRVVPIFKVNNDFVVSHNEGRILIEFESFIKPY
jgi:hypothetical protein